MAVLFYTQITFRHHRDVGQLSCTRLHYQIGGQDTQQQRTCGLPQVSQYENPTLPANIKVVSWVAKYKQYEYIFWSYFMREILVMLCTFSGIY